MIIEFCLFWFFYSYDKMVGYFGYVGGYVLLYLVSGYGLNYFVLNIDFFS